MLKRKISTLPVACLMFATLAMAGAVTGATFSGVAGAFDGVSQDQDVEPPPTPDVQGSEPQQLTTEDYQDWRQAGDGDGGVGESLRNQVVRLDDNQGISGRIVLVEQASGTLIPAREIRLRLIHRGTVAATVTPKADGTFWAGDLRPGLYSLVASGRGAFAAFAFNVRESAPDAEAVGTLNIEAAAVAPRDFPALKRVIATYLPDRDDTEWVEPGDVPDVLGAEQANSVAGTSLQHHQIRLTTDRRFIGRLRRMHPVSGRAMKFTDMNVFLVRNGRRVAQTPVAANGTFQFADVTPGVYSVIAGGSDGFLAMAADILAPEQFGFDRRNGVMPVGFALAGEQLDAGVVPASDLNTSNFNNVTDSADSEDSQTPAVADATTPPPADGGAPLAGGGGGTSPVGGGGGGAGGDGFGALLGLAGVGLAAAALADDDDGGGGGQDAPQSPANP